MTDHGGPAFPRTSQRFVSQNCAEQIVSGHSGMTLRDYFAGQALAFLGPVIAAPHMRASGAGGGALSEADIASQAYDIADAMLKARASQ